MAESCESNPLALLVMLADRLRGVFDQAAADCGLTAAQAQVLVRVDGAIRLSDLAHLQSCDPSTITTMVQRLERDGLVRRTVDPLDARARLVQSTAKGRRTRQRFMSIVGDGVSVIQSLTDDQRRALADLFRDTDPAERVSGGS